MVCGFVTGSSPRLSTYYRCGRRGWGQVFFWTSRHDRITSSSPRQYVCLLKEFFFAFACYALPLVAISLFTGWMRRKLPSCPPFCFRVLRRPFSECGGCYQVILPGCDTLATYSLSLDHQWGTVVVSEGLDVLIIAFLFFPFTSNLLDGRKETSESRVLWSTLEPE